jgi:hypothetical protein
MRDELLHIDRPVSAPQGQRRPEFASGGLQFSRSFRISPDAVMEQWSDPFLRKVWLTPFKNSHFKLMNAGPACLEAIETAGEDVVSIRIVCGCDGDLTSLAVLLQPCAQISPSILIASGYADHWEERLYALADAMMTHQP